MGLFDRLFGSSESRDESKTLEDSAKAHIENPEESDILRDPELLEGKVNVDSRTEIIDSYYDSVSSDEAQYIAEILKEYLETYDLQKHEAKTTIENETGLDSNRVTEIFWTERASIQTCNNVRDNLERNISLSFEWMVGDDPCSPICAEVEEMTTESEQSISLVALQEMLREKAEEYQDEGGTPERMDHWVPHHKCKATLMSRVD